MNKKIIFGALSIGALLVSCDKQINIATAKKYIKEHAKYTIENAPIASKIIIKWDFGNTEENIARNHFPAAVGSYIGDVNYKKTGEAEIIDSYKESLSRGCYLDEAAGDAIVDEDKVYLNNTGIKISTKYCNVESYNVDIEYSTQWDKECKILSSKSINTCDSYRCERYFTFKY